MLDILLASAELLGGLASLAAVAALHPRSRRVAVAVLRYGKAHMSPWMMAVFGACLLIPGPLDEVVVLPLMVGLTLRTPRNRMIFRRYMAVAWKGASA